jgi:hypothetical protein
MPGGGDLLMCVRRNNSSLSPGDIEELAKQKRLALQMRLRLLWHKRILNAKGTSNDIGITTIMNTLLHQFYASLIKPPVL